MKKYLVQFCRLEQYEIEIEAESEDAAIEGAKNADCNHLDSLSVHCDYYEIVE